MGPYNLFSDPLMRIFYCQICFSMCTIYKRNTMDRQKLKKWTSNPPFKFKGRVNFLFWKEISFF